jgi:hypothetical protein
MKSGLLIVLFGLILFLNLLSQPQSDLLENAYKKDSVEMLNCIAQSYTPIQLTEQIFTNRQFKNIDKYCIGEYKGIPKAKDFSKSFKLKFKVIFQNDSAANINMTISDSTEKKGTDTYIFLVKDSVWKITSFRALAKTSMLVKMIEEYSAFNETQIDSLIQIEKMALHPNINSRADFELMMENVKLTIDFDNNIIQHFLDNKISFEVIKNKAQKFIASKKSEMLKTEKLISGLENEFRPLLITSVYYNSDYIKFLIGGAMDNMVGYIYCKDKTLLPSMSPNSFILIREIGDGWYLYKTT